MKKYRIGYTQGTFDMFHIGHLNLIKHACELCDTLIVGVNSDSLVEEYKHKVPIINEKERAEIVRNIKGVDKCYVVSTLDKMDAHTKYNYDVIFIGDDWKGNSRWERTKEELASIGVDLIFLPHTDGISSTALTDVIKHIINDDTQ